MSSSSIMENKPIIVTLVVVLAVIVGLIFYFVSSTDDEPVVKEEVAIPAQQAPPPRNEPPPPEPERPEPIKPDMPEEPPAPEEPKFVLPRLDESDQLIRDGVVSLTRHEGINGWLAPNELVRKFVAFTDNVAHGQVAKAPVRNLAPEGPFLVKPLTAETFELDPASYDRYNEFTAVVTSMDARRAAEFYHLLRPLVQSAYGELGYGDRQFDDVVFQSIGRLLETPVIEEPIVLVRPVVMYKFQDENLESLTPVQKQLIRMGPENTRKLQNKIREIARELRDILDE